MTTQLAPDADAAMVVGIASTAMPFARSREAEAERWLRILRLNGEAGVALQALGVSEGPLEAVGESADGERPGCATAESRDVVALVSEDAARVASRRGAPAFGTSDVLVAVMDVYGADFDRVLRIHGTDRDEVLERLGVEPSDTPEG
jgi:hypothetical protein